MQIEDKKDSDEKEIIKKEEKRKKKRLMDLLKENLSCEMYQFLISLFETPHLVIKIFLLLCLLIAYGLASYTTIILILSYLEYGVTTSIRTVTETPAVFPKVTFCSINPLSTLYSFQMLKNISDTNSLVNKTRHEKNIISSTLNSAILGSLSGSSQYEKMKVSHNLQDIVLSCMFNFVSCDLNQFKWEFDPFYGNCWSFNSGFNSSGGTVDLKTSSVPGNGFGLQLELYLNYYENLTYFNSIAGGRGAIIRIDNVSHAIDYARDGIQISTGFSTSIALKRVFKSSLPKPYSDCDIDDVTSSSTIYSDLYTLIVKSPVEYTQKYCLIQCLQKLAFDKCNCTYSFFGSVIKGNVCTTNDELNCAFNQYYVTYSTNSYVQKVCIPQCPLECSSSMFTYTLSSLELVGDSYVDNIESNTNLTADFVNSDITSATAKGSVARICIFYDTLSYTILEESPQWDIITLIASIGGNLGLFLGVCLFSLGEIVTTLMEIYFFYKK